MSFSLEIAARTLYGEARGETEDGQRAVAHVLVNRQKDGRWGKSLAEVCLARRQFSCWNDEDPNKMKLAALNDDDPLLTKLRGFVQAALLGDPDPTMGARWYYAVSMKTPPPWAEGMPFVQIGNHRFLKTVK